MLIYIPSWVEHVAQFKNMFCWLGAVNLTLNLFKCEFGQATGSHLGIVVSSCFVQPIETKVEAILTLAFLMPRIQGIP